MIWTNDLLSVYISVPVQCQFQQKTCVICTHPVASFLWLPQRVCLTMPRSYFSSTFSTQELHVETITPVKLPRCLSKEQHFCVNSFCIKLDHAESRVWYIIEFTVNTLTSDKFSDFNVADKIEYSKQSIIKDGWEIWNISKMNHKTSKSNSHFPFGSI